MNELSAMIWIETRKAIRSRMPLWTTLAALFMPCAVAFLIFLSKNPDLLEKLGLVGAKANLIAYAATDWPAYLNLTSQLIAAGGFFFFVLIISWVFGREYIDGTLKDLLAVPVRRSSILLAKFILAAAWSSAIAFTTLMISLLIGAAIRLPGGQPEIILLGSGNMLAATCLTIIVVFPFGWLASAGRGYLLPLGAAVLTLMLTNLVAIMGWGEYFPWAIPGIHAQGKTSLPPISFLIVLLTGAAGIIGTILWWKYTDQSR